ncbi:DUF2255 family protein [Brachybacterium saurashtrense]|uniref:DUF2255 family protein n=1 Tax=Brachybacterium saurashtrense TaxID=556288 RepID=A0A345YP39_9MICO|nr:DUF2255 family protein [Brachybacterium saurashtrense]AXK45691.1 DUF2255 family protein [Brachybacterium saurashtrense]RRR24709.1 DUF2255 family protein [Brachybacterium saurashtrense]
MSTWTTEQLQAIAGSDDFHIAPYRADGHTPGTLTWIWSVVVDGAVYVRAYNGTASRWYRSALAQKAGRITAGGLDTEVAFTPVAGQLDDAIDAAYSQKYAGSPYLPPMIAERTRAATVRVDPR